MTNSADAMTAAATPPASTTTTPPPIDQIAEALKALARGAPTDLSGLLHDVESHAEVGGTRVTVHCHCIQLDVVIDAACGESGTNFVRLSEHTELEHDWRYLLLSASVLAQSEQGRCQQAGWA